MDPGDLHEIMEPSAPDDHHVEMQLGRPAEVSGLVTDQQSRRPGEGLGR